MLPVHFNGSDMSRPCGWISAAPLFLRLSNWGKTRETFFLKCFLKHLKIIIVFEIHVINGYDYKNIEHQIGCVGICVGCEYENVKALTIVYLKFAQVLLVNHQNEAWRYIGAYLRNSSRRAKLWKPWQRCQTSVRGMFDQADGDATSVNTHPILAFVF